MKPQDAFLYCQLCSRALQPDGDHAFSCSGCHHTWFINPIPSNAAVITNEEGKILLVRRAVSPKKGYWDLPGGFIQPGEDLVASIQRELREELQCEAEVLHIIGIYPDTYEYQGIQFPTLCVAAAVHLLSTTITPSDDADGYAYFALDELPQQKIAFPSLEKALHDYFQQLQK